MSDFCNMDEKELWDKYGSMQKSEEFYLGRHYSYQMKNTPRHILFTLSRYKFAAKMIGFNKQILELGCSEGIGTPYLSEFSCNVKAIDFDAEAIEWAKKYMENDKVLFDTDNFLDKKYGDFDAIVSFDVVEHIYEKNEKIYFDTVINNLNKNGIFIIGTPNIECSKYSKKEVLDAHVNMYSADRLIKVLGTYFHNVFLFTQSDEIIHTGFNATANYLLCLCCNRKSDKL